MVARYLGGVADQDWDVVEACLAGSVRRDGPYGDDVEGIVDYLAFLRRTMPSLPGYRMDLDRVTALGDGRVVAELRETVDAGGAPLETHECLVFALADGLIERVSIYLRQAPVSPAAGAVGSAG